jgi:hypothetical protein
MATAGLQKEHTFSVHDPLLITYITLQITQGKDGVLFMPAAFAACPDFEWIQT